MVAFALQDTEGQVIELLLFMLSAVAGISDQPVSEYRVLASPQPLSREQAIDVLRGMPVPAFCEAVYREQRLEIEYVPVEDEAGQRGFQHDVAFRLGAWEDHSRELGLGSDEGALILFVAGPRSFVSTIRAWRLIMTRYRVPHTSAWAQPGSDLFQKAKEMGAVAAVWLGLGRPEGEFSIEWTEW